MRLSASLKLVMATWIAALVGALAGGALAHATITTPQDTPATIVAGQLGPETSPR
jgi:hypothetical protein